MLFYIYVIALNDGMSIKDMFYYNVWRRISNNQENIANIMSAGGGGASVMDMNV